MLLVINCVTLLYWFLILSPPYRLFFVRTYVDKKYDYNFVNNFLSADLFLTILFIKESETVLYVSDFLNCLYNLWYNNYKIKFIHLDFV